MNRLKKSYVIKKEASSSDNFIMFNDYDFREGDFLSIVSIQHQNM